MAALIEHGMLLQSARGPLPNVAELVAGEPIAGSWWGHPQGHAIFAALQSLDDSPDVVRMRLVNGKVTLVHRRLWPALVRVADRFSQGSWRRCTKSTLRRALTASMSSRFLTGCPPTSSTRRLDCRTTRPSPSCRRV